MAAACVPFCFRGARRNKYCAVPHSFILYGGWWRARWYKNHYTTSPPPLQTVERELRSIPHVPGTSGRCVPLPPPCTSYFLCCSTLHSSRDPPSHPQFTTTPLPPSSDAPLLPLVNVQRINSPSGRIRGCCSHQRRHGAVSFSLVQTAQALTDYSHRSTDVLPLSLQRCSLSLQCRVVGRCCPTTAPPLFFIIAHSIEYAQYIVLHHQVLYTVHTSTTAA